MVTTIFITGFIVALLIASLFLAMMYVEDDTKLKLVLWIIIALAVVAIIGIWESVLKPLWSLLATHVFPMVPEWWNTYILRK